MYSHRIIEKKCMHSPPHPFPTRRSSDLRSIGNTFAKNSLSRSHLPASCGESDDVAHVSMTSGSPANPPGLPRDRKSTRLNSSHVATSYAVFSLTKKN